MIWIFLASALFGCSFLVPMLLGGLSGDAEIGDGLDGGDLDLDAGDVGVDVDTELDFDAEIDADTSTADGIGAAESGLLEGVFDGLLSFRSLVFISAFFGTSGVVFDLAGYGTMTSTLTAAFIGLVAGLANSALHTLLRNSQSNSQITERSLEGRPAVVTLPIEAGRRGRIRIDMAGQPQYMVARSYDDRPMPEDDDSSGSHRTPVFDVGANVVVVQIENGTALVASLAELDSSLDLD